MHIAAALPTVGPVGLGVGSFFVLLGITVRPQVYLMLLMKINLTVVFTRTERAKVENWRIHIPSLLHPC